MVIKLQNHATLWKKSALDANGEWTYLSPIPIVVRWEDRVQRFQHQDGTERIGNCVLYSSSPLLAIDDKVALGPRNALLAAFLGEAGLNALAESLGLPRASLDALLALPYEVEGVDYSVLTPYNAPNIRTIGGVNASPSVGDSQSTLYKYIGE